MTLIGGVLVWYTKLAVKVKLTLVRLSYDPRWCITDTQIQNLPG